MPIEVDFQADAKDVAKRHSFFPGNVAEGYDPTQATQTDLQHRFAGFKHTVIDQAQKIARVSLQESITGRGTAVLVSPSLTAHVGIPVYFLPWDSDGAAVEMTIPNRDPALAEVTHPRFFFTAVLSGCSIIFKGSAQRPTIFHCGTAGATGGGAATVGDSNDFFRDLVRRAELQGLGRTDARLPNAAPRQVLSTDYMITRAGGGNAPVDAQNPKNAIQAHYGNRMVVEDVVLWGVVFGIRTARDWKFYLQQNGTIVYKTIAAVLRDIEVTQTKKFGFIKYKTRKTQTVSRFELENARFVSKPISLTQIFPGTGIAKVTNSWKSLL